jgi:hypothetical protein
MSRPGLSRMSLRRIVKAIMKENVLLIPGVARGENVRGQALGAIAAVASSSLLPDEWGLCR